MGKRGTRGAFDENERERRRKIRAAFEKALAANDDREFWKVIRLAGIPEQSEQAVTLYEKWRELNEVSRRRNC